MAGAGDRQAPSPDDVDIPIVTYDFEGAGLGVNWTVADADAGNGTDTWARSTYRASSGNGSAWAAGLGNRTFNSSVAVFSDGFEGNITANWTVGDSDTTYGEDYWGPSTTRAHSGSTSLWSAAVGFNDEDGTDTNANLSVYDSYMQAFAWRNVTLPPALMTLMTFHSA